MSKIKIKNILRLADARKHLNICYKDDNRISECLNRRYLSNLSTYQVGLGVQMFKLEQYKVDIVLKTYITKVLYGIVKKKIK